MKKYQYIASWDDQTLTRVGEPVVVLGDSNVSQVEVIMPANFLLDPTKAEARIYFLLPGEKESDFETLETATKDENGDSHVTWTIKHVHSQRGGRLAFSLALIGDDAQWDSRTAIIPVYESRYQPESEEAEEPYTGRLAALEGSMAAVRGEFAEVQDDFEELKETATLGTPIPESLVANMTEGRAYIYTGMEPGYTAGHVYYYVNGTLTDGGVYGGTAIDATLTQSGQAADAKVTGDKIAEIKEDLDGLRTHPVLTWDIGKNISATGTVQNNQYTALTKPIPVDGGDVVVRTTPANDNDGKSLIVYINTYILDVWSERISLAYNDSYAIPDGVTTIRIGYGRAASSGVTMTQTDVDAYFSADFFTYSTFVKQRNPIVGSSFSENTKLGVYNFGGSSMAPYNAMTDAPAETFGGGCMTVIPSGSNPYNRIQIIYDLANRIIYRRYLSYNNSTAKYNAGDWTTADFGELFATTGIKWAAIGDSITYGVYSIDSTTTAVDTANCYVQRVADAIHAETFTNLGVRGLGFTHSGNGNETLKDNVIDATDWTDYNLVTVALGVNDYYGNMTIGTESATAWDGTVYGAIRGTIESILTANPSLKLIFITPFNMAKSGSLSTHWGKGYTKSKVGTLDDVKTAIIYWCDYYGIEYINETDCSVVNDLNISTMLLDALHPSASAHELIARELVKKISFS